jgi:NAD(P)-dependent dehydrogenase (short-subunit alcohol dehydrogenase family)
LPRGRRPQRINFGSSAGVSGSPGGVAHNCTKAAIRAFGRTAAREWAPHGIRANVICPAVETESLLAARERNPDHPANLSTLPLGYFGDPERDAGALATFLASAEGDYLSGNTIFMEGGWHFVR